MLTIYILVASLGVIGGFYVGYRFGKEEGKIEGFDDGFLYAQKFPLKEKGKE